MDNTVIFLNSTVKGPRFPENGLTKIQMMSFVVQSCLMHEEAYVLSWKEKYHIGGRCQAAQGDAESETQNQIFLSCDTVTCSVSAPSLLGEDAELYVIMCPIA